MNQLQKAAEVLNKNAPVDGPFGKESIAYINPLEAEILKKLGGSGDTIIPSADEQMESVQSYGLFKWIKKKIVDDVLGIDDNKFLGMKKKTLLGGAALKVTDDILGIDSSKTFGISDATIDDALSTAVGLVNPAAGLAVTALDKTIENNSGDTSGRQKQREDIAQMREDIRVDFDAKRQAALGEGKGTFEYTLPDGTVKTYYTDPGGNTGGEGVPDGNTNEGVTGGATGDTAGGTTEGATGGTAGGAQDGGGASASSGSSDMDLANQRALTSSLISRGKGGIIDPSDTAKMQQYLARPGDPDYLEGFSVGGEYVDPFPDYLRGAGDSIIDGINDTGTNINNYIGTPEERMGDFDPIMERLLKMSDQGITEAEKIFGSGEGSVEDTYTGFQDQFRELANQQKGLNTRTAQSNQGLADNVLAAGDRNANALRDSIYTQAGLADQGYDELEKYSGRGFDNLADYSGRSYDNARDFSDRGFDYLGDNRDKGFRDFADYTGRGYDQLLGDTDLGFGTLYDSTKDSYGQRSDFSKRGFGALGDSVDRGYGTLGDSVTKGFGRLGSGVSQGYGTLGDSISSGFGALGDSINRGYGGFGDSITKGYGSLGDSIDSSYGDAGRSISGAYDTLGGSSGVGYDTLADYSGRGFDEREALTDQSYDALRAGRLEGGLAQAAAERANATQEAAAQRRALNQTGITRGTGTDMASRMIGANLGQSQTAALADTLRGGSELDASRFRELANLRGDRLAQMGDILSGKQFEGGRIGSEGMLRLGDSNLQGGLQSGRARSEGILERGGADLAGALEGGQALSQGLLQRGQADSQGQLRLGDVESQGLFERGQVDSEGMLRRGDVDSRNLFTQGDLAGDRALDLGRIGMDRLFNRGQLSSDKTFNLGDISRDRYFDRGRIGSDKLFGAGDIERNRYADLGRIYSDKEFARGDIGNNRYQRLSDINPGLANVYGSQADLQNRLRALSYGDQMLGAEGSNLGIDQALLDDRRGLYDSLRNMRLGNTSLIDGLGAQRARLPGFYADAALDPLGGLIRNVSPYSSTGLLPSPVSSYNPNPYNPGYGGGGGFSWNNAFRNAPAIVGGARQIFENDLPTLFG